nr:hypothetical protein [Pedobacter sp. V48]
MEFGSSLLKSRGTPSTIVNAPVRPVVAGPLTMSCEPSCPGSPLACLAMSPETRPTKELVKLTTGFCATSFTDSVDTAAVVDVFFCVP